MNCADAPAAFDIPGEGSYTGALTGAKATAENGRLRVEIKADGGEIWIPDGEDRPDYTPVQHKAPEPEAPITAATPEPQRAAPGKRIEDMTVEELQAEVLARLAANGPVTDRMHREVRENVYRDSLLNWVRSFR